MGGAWRNLALVNMTVTNYPLHVVQQYEMSAAEAMDVSRFVARQSKNSLERIPGLSKKRAETLPVAAVVLHTLIQQLGVKRVAISAYGVREGLLLNNMPPHIRAQDPLVEGCATLAARDNIHRRVRTGAGGVAGAPVVRPAALVRPDAGAGAAGRRLPSLDSLGAHLHPDHRADLAFDLVLRAPIAGQTHQERAFLAITAFNRYTSTTTNPEPAAISRLLSPEQLTRARALGAALRLGCDLSGRSPQLLNAAALSQDRGELVLAMKSPSTDMFLGEQTQKRAAQLATALGLALRVKAR